MGKCQKQYCANGGTKSYFAKYNGVTACTCPSNNAPRKGLIPVKKKWDRIFKKWKMPYYQWKPMGTFKSVDKVPGYNNKKSSAWGKDPKKGFIRLVKCKRITSWRDRKKVKYWWRDRRVVCKKKVMDPPKFFGERCEFSAQCYTNNKPNKQCSTCSAGGCNTQTCQPNPGAPDRGQWARMHSSHKSMPQCQAACGGRGRFHAGKPTLTLTLNYSCGSLSTNPNPKPTSLRHTVFTLFLHHVY